MAPCKVCVHALRTQIDAQLLAGTPYLLIAKRFSVSAAGLSRHRRHVTALRTPRVQPEQPSKLQRQAESLLRAATRALRIANKKGDAKAAVAAIGASTRLIAVLAKLSAAGAIRSDAPAQSETEDTDEIELATIFDRETNHFDPQRIAELKAIADAENAKFPVLQSGAPAPIQPPKFGDNSGTVASNE